MFKSFVVVKTSFQAIHCWPECPFEEVSFLRDPHRHIFHVEVKIETTGDRQIEFIMLKNKLNLFLNENYEGKNLGRKSCETMAREISDYLNSDFVSVFEDNENGAECVRLRNN